MLVKYFYKFKLNGAFRMMKVAIIGAGPRSLSIFRYFERVEEQGLWRGLHEKVFK